MWWPAWSGCGVHVGNIVVSYLCGECVLLSSVACSGFVSRIVVEVDKNSFKFGEEGDSSSCGSKGLYL